MDTSIEEGILKSSKPMKAITNEEAGIAWASDAVRDALSKDTPEECKFYLDSLRVMALQLLANECFNVGLGLGKATEGVPTELKWNIKRYTTATHNVLRSINSRVNVLIKMQKEGKLQLATSTKTPIESESNVVGIR
jgi:hypothetical protein